MTSALCDDQKAGNYKFKVYDPSYNDFIDKKVPNRCNSMAFDMHQSNSSKILSRTSSKLTYGSANLQGFVWEDSVCVDKSHCSPFQFLALYRATGLEDNTDGILGLSPHKSEELRQLHFLWALKDHKVIDKAVVSFSIASDAMKDSSFATFGGVEPS